MIQHPPSPPPGDSNTVSAASSLEELNERSKPPLIVLGSGEYNAMYIDMFEEEAESYPYRLAGFSQNVDPESRGETLHGYPVYTLDELRELAPTHRAHCTLGDCGSKRRFVEQVEALGFRFATLFAPGSRRLGVAEIGEGSYLGHDSGAYRGVRLGKHCTILSLGNLADGVTLGDYCFTGVRATLCGGVTVGSDTFVGVGAIITERVNVGSNVIIGAGSVVIRDVLDGATVVGNPAREIRPGHRLFRKPAVEEA